MPVNYLSAERLSKSFNEKILFEDLTLGLDQGQKAALVGVNGCGKSTLLRILAGIEPPDSGEMSFQKGLTVAYLDQSPRFKGQATIADAIFDHEQPEAAVLKDYHQLLDKEHPTQEEHKKLQQLLEEIEALNAWEYEYRAKEILGKLGIHDLEQTVDALSGGQQKRIALAKVLVGQPDFLLLDEPTNHLDLDLIEWLEDYLSTRNLTLLMVTHDRYFLDKVTNEIIEMENGRLYRYQGNYSHYLEKKAEREELEQQAKDKARNLMKKELDWMRRQPKARGTKAKYRVDAFQDLKEKASVNLTKSELDIRVKEKRQGKKILELKNLGKSFGEIRLFENFSHIFTRGEKVGIVGKNGTGKSTFLNVITGQLAPDSGTIEPGVNTQFGYYTQSELRFDQGQKVIDLVQSVAEVITLADGKVITASQFLNLFLFPPTRQHDFVSKLSGGEKRRLQLLMVLIANPNFLILDEPTNDLDILTLNVLEDYLQQFSGCLLLVSHDRYFMDRLVDHLLVFDKSPVIRDFPGNYTDYRLEQNQKPKQELATPAKEKTVKVKTSAKKKLSFKEQKELASLEGEIAEMEQEKAGLLERMNAGSGDHTELAQWAQDIESLEEKLGEKELRWLELSEREG